MSSGNSVFHTVKLILRQNSYFSFLCTDCSDDKERIKDFVVNQCYFPENINWDRIKMIVLNAPERERGR